MTPADSTPLSHVDAAWLRMDRATNPMVITAMLVFGTPLEPHAVDTLVAGLLANERFRQHVVEPTLGGPRWETDPHFDCVP